MSVDITKSDESLTLERLSKLKQYEAIGTVEHFAELECINQENDETITRLASENGVLNTTLNAYNLSGDEKYKELLKVNNGYRDLVNEYKKLCGRLIDENMMYDFLLKQSIPVIDHESATAIDDMKIIFHNELARLYKICDELIKSRPLQSNLVYKSIKDLIMCMTGELKTQKIDIDDILKNHSNDTLDFTEMYSYNSQQCDCATIEKLKAENESLKVQLAIYQSDISD